MRHYWFLEGWCIQYIWIYIYFCLCEQKIMFNEWLQSKTLGSFCNAFFPHLFLFFYLSFSSHCFLSSEFLFVFSLHRLNWGFCLFAFVCVRVQGVWMCLECVYCWICSESVVHSMWCVAGQTVPPPLCWLIVFTVHTDSVWSPAPAYQPASQPASAWHSDSHPRVKGRTHPSLPSCAMYNHLSLPPSLPPHHPKFKNLLII